MEYHLLPIFLSLICIQQINGQVINALDFRLKPLSCQNGYYGQLTCLCFDTGADALRGPTGRFIRVVNCSCWYETISTLQSFVNEIVRPITIRVMKCKGMQLAAAGSG